MDKVPLSVFNDHPVESTSVCNEWARCNASASPSSASSSTPVDFTPSREGRSQRSNGRREGGEVVQTPPVLHSASHPRHDQYYAPELRHPNRPRDELLLVRSIRPRGKCNFRARKFAKSGPKSGTRNSKDDHADLVGDWLDDEDPGNRAKESSMNTSGDENTENGFTKRVRNDSRDNRDVSTEPPCHWESSRGSMIF